MYEFAVKGEVTMPIKTKLLLNYQYQSKNGEKNCTKHYLQVASIRKIAVFANKISS